MQDTSAAWKALLASENARLEAVTVIGGKMYREITAPVISRGLMQGGLSIGNAVSASCQFTVRTGDAIPKSAKVQIRMRLNDGQTVSEWLPAGTFYISHRSRDIVAGLVTLECYDALMKANANMPVFVNEPWTDNNGTTITTDTGEIMYFYAAMPEPGDGIDDSAFYPYPMDRMAGALAAALGVEIDPRTQIATGAAYVVEQPERGTTIHDVLGLIAAANGGNWIITPEGKLRLVPVVSSDNAQDALLDVVDVAAVLGQITLEGSGTVTGLRYNTDEEPVLIGDETGIVVEADVTAAIAYDLSETLIGTTYQAYGLQGAIYDPAAELGDYVRAGANGEVRSALYSETVTLGPMFRGDISAPETGEMSDEYPYIGSNTKALNILKSTIKALEETAITNVNVEYAQNQSTTIAPTSGWSTDAPAWRDGWYIWQRTATTTSDGTAYSDPVCISGRDGVDGQRGPQGPQGQPGATGVGVSKIAEQYYLSRSSSTQTGGSWSGAQPAWSPGMYIWTRSLITWTDGNTSTTQPVLASAINGANETANTASQDADNALGAVAYLDTSLNQQGVFNRLTNNGQDQGIYLYDGKIYINGTYMQIGTITGANGDNYWILDGANAIFVATKGRIGSFTLDNGALIYGTPGENGNGIRMRYDGFLTSYGGSSSGIVSYSWLHNGWLEIGNYGYGSAKFNAPSAYNGGFSISVTNADGSFTRVPLYCDNSDADRKIVFGGPFKTLFQNDVTVSQGTLTTQNLQVTGTKNRKVSTDQYSDRLLYCYETPSPMFGDVGEGEIGADGRCYVWLDAVFAQTISTEGYQVFLQRYGAGDCWVAERRPGCFIVEGEPGLRFGWEIKAKQRDFDQRRLDTAEQPYTPTETDYGALAAAHINDIRQERELT